MKFLLTSVGITNNDIAQALSDLAGKPLSNVSFLFIPTAANLEPGSKEWLEENITEFQKQNFASLDIIDIAAVPVEEWKALFRKADVICFGGGNEQYLAKVCNELGMKEFLQNFMNEKVFMGISAGSMIAGKFIPYELMKIVYPEEVYEELGDSFGLVDFCFIPHLNSEWYTKVRKETLENLKEQLSVDVYATDDETALMIENGKVNVVGKGDFWISK